MTATSPFVRMEIYPTPNSAASKSSFMATPFLWSGLRFDVRDVYAAMPRFVQQNPFGICMFGFWIASYVLIGALQRCLPADIRTDLLRGHGEISPWQLPLYFLAP